MTEPTTPAQNRTTSRVFRLGWRRRVAPADVLVHRHRAHELSLSKTATRSDEWEVRLATLVHFSAKKRVRLYLRLERFTTKNIPLKRSIEMIWARLNRTGDSRRAVFRRVIEQMDEGLTFESAMAPYLPSAERLLIFAGEDTGAVQKGFAKAAYVAEAVKRMRAVVTGALAYPAVLFVMLCMILWGMATQFIPILLQIAPLSQWPAVSMALYYVATTVQYAGFWILVALGITAFLVAKSLPTWTGPGRAFVDRWIAPYTTYREYQASIFLISLAALIDAGRPDVQAIKQLAQISRPWLRQHLTRMLTSLLAGDTPGRALDTGLLTSEVLGDVEDYTSVGAFDDAVAQIGKETVEDAIERIGLSAAIAKYIMMVLVAGSILLIYSGIIFVVMDVAQRAQSGAI
jgi:type II secretory pathway component PulF